MIIESIRPWISLVTFFIAFSCFGSPFANCSMGNSRRLILSILFHVSLIGFNLYLVFVVFHAFVLPFGNGIPFEFTRGVFFIDFDLIFRSITLSLTPLLYWFQNSRVSCNLYTLVNLLICFKSRFVLIISFTWFRKSLSELLVLLVLLLLPDV